jgi:hypothetical protein
MFLRMNVEVESHLVPFVQAAKRGGASDAFIVELLKASGWPERRIYAAFSIYYARVTGMAVPVRGNRFEYAGDGFLYLLAFISLAFWATGAGHLLYVLIDGWFPNTLDQPYVTATLRDRVSLELATIIVAYPIFITVSRVINRQLADRPESADSGVRKWLTDIALVIAATVLLGDAIFFLQSFLHGDLSMRFVLDTLVLFAIVGSIFAYYLSTLRGEPVLTARDRSFTAASAAFVVFVLVCGFGNLGSPGRQHALSLDDRRVDDLAFIQSRIAAGYDQTRHSGRASREDRPPRPTVRPALRLRARRRATLPAVFRFRDRRGVAALTGVRTPGRTHVLQPSGGRAIGGFPAACRRARAVGTGSVRGEGRPAEREELPTGDPENPYDRGRGGPHAADAAVPYDRAQLQLPHVR